VIIYSHVFSSYLEGKRPNILRAQDVRDSNLVPKAGYPELQFRGIPQFVHRKAGVVP